MGSFEEKQDLYKVKSPFKGKKSAKRPPLLHMQVHKNCCLHDIAYLWTAIHSKYIKEGFEKMKHLPNTKSILAEERSTPPPRKWKLS